MNPALRFILRHDANLDSCFWFEKKPTLINITSGRLWMASLRFCFSDLSHPHIHASPSKTQQTHLSPFGERLSFAAHQGRSLLTFRLWEGGCHKRVATLSNSSYRRLSSVASYTSHCGQIYFCSTDDTFYDLPLNLPRRNKDLITI